MSSGEPPAWLVREPASTADAVPHVACDDLGYIAGLRVVAASRRGRSHAHEATYREDAFELARVGDGWAIAVADGAGCAPLARVGSGLAVRTAIATLVEYAGRETPTTAIERAARAALAAVCDEACRRQRTAEDLATTLLLALYDMSHGQPSLTAFQAGDGLIAAVAPDLGLRLLGTPDHETYAGGTRFLTGSVVRGTISARVRHVEIDTALQGVLVATDGISDDLIPYARNLPILGPELDRVVQSPLPGEALLELLDYEQRASFDDRTLAVAWRPGSGCPR